MIVVKIDANGNYIVQWPRKAADILTLASRYIAQQLSLAPAEQLKDVPLATVQALYTQASTAATNATGGETTRATSAETLRQRIEQAKGYRDLIFLRLKGQYANNLAQLEGWGIPSTVGKRGITLKKPGNQNEIIAFLRAYVAKETSLPAEQRITDPSLATIQALLDDIETALANRITARDQREVNVETRGQVLDELLNWLRTACLILVMQGGGSVSTTLQRHGYLIVARTRPDEKAPVEGTSGEPVPA